MGHDPDGNPRWIAVKVGGLVVWHSAQEYERFMYGLDREACDELRKDPP